MGLTVFIVLDAVFAIGVALLSPALPALLVRAAPPGQFGACLGIESLTVNFARIVAPPIFGFFRVDRSLRWAAAAMCIATIATSMCLDASSRENTSVESCA